MASETKVPRMFARHIDTFSIPIFLMPLTHVHVDASRRQLEQIARLFTVGQRKP